MPNKQPRKLTINNVSNESFNNVAEIRKAMQANSVKTTQQSSNMSQNKPKDKEKSK